MQKIAFIQTAFLGDVVLGTSVTETLRNLYPDAQIDYIVRKGNEGLLDGNPSLSNVLILDKKNKYKSLLQLIKLIRSTKYDWVINANRFFSAGVLTALSGAPKRSGYKNATFSTLFTDTYAHDMMDGRHEIIRLNELLGTTTKVHKPRLYVDHIQLPEAYTSLPGYITMAPSSVWETKKLPIKKWIQLANKTSHTVVIIGAPADRALGEQIISSSSNTNIINACGELNLLQSAKLIQSARMNYANDSAPLHMASALNAPVTGFYLSTAPILGYTPLSDISIIKEVQEDLDCRPCGLHGKRSCPKGHFKCAEIDV